MSCARHFGGAEAMASVADGDRVGCVLVVHPRQPVEIEGVAVGPGFIDRGVAERERADVRLVSNSLSYAVIALGDESPAVEGVPARVVVANRRDCGVGGHS